jgi:hypothetical protein
MEPHENTEVVGIVRFLLYIYYFEGVGFLVSSLALVARPDFLLPLILRLAPLSRYRQSGHANVLADSQASVDLLLQGVLSGEPDSGRSTFGIDRNQNSRIEVAEARPL